MRLTFGATLYNEEASVPHITNLVFQVLKRFPDDQFVFVDNGSTDRTHFLLSSAFKNNQSVRVIQNTKSCGYGDGVRRVLSEVETENVLKLVLQPCNHLFRQRVQLLSFMALLNVYRLHLQCGGSCVGVTCFSPHPHVHSGRPPQCSYGLNFRK